MNVDNFKSSLECMSYCGINLDPEKTALIEKSLIILQSENKFSQIFFWGRINGIENDYYIAFGYTEDCARARRFFFSVNCIKWYLLPPHNPDQYEACILIPDQFQGDITRITEVTMDPNFVLGVDDILRPSKRSKFKLKEEDRLSCMVNLITEESAILPRGALYKNVDGKTIYNPMFRGLSLTDGSKFENYLLYRNPREKWNANLLKKINYNYSVDIFDSTDIIVPREQSFCLTIEQDPIIVFIKSLHWPGMVFFHKCRTEQHGFCYFGDARKNLDLLFML